MKQNVRKKWYQKKYEDRSGFREVFTWYLSGICVLFFMIGILFSENVDRLVAVQASGLQSLSFWDYLLILLFIASIVLAVILGLMISHRVFGPVYRLVKHMENFHQNGAAEELVLRKGDYFIDVVESYNKMLERVRNTDAKM